MSSGKVININYFLGVCVGIFIGREVGRLYSRERHPMSIRAHGADASSAREEITSNAASLKGEEEFLFQEVSGLDRDNPDWYHQSLVASAEQLLNDGSDLETVAAICGGQIADEAESRRKRIA